MACQCSKADDTSKESDVLSVPYVVHESEMSRAERREKRLWIAVIVLIFSLIATNVGWLIYESQFETIYWEQDGDGLNNMNTGEQGDVTFEPEREVQAEEVRGTQGDQSFQ